MVSSTTPISQQTLDNFASIIDGTIFKEDTPFYGPAYVIATTVVCIAGAIFFNNWRMTAIAGVIAIGSYILCGVIGNISLHILPEREAKIQSAFRSVVKVLREETYYKQQSFMKVFKDIPLKLQNNREAQGSLKNALLLYQSFYDSGTDLEEWNSFSLTNNLLPTAKEELVNVSSASTISMNNYRQLRPLAHEFLRCRAYCDNNLDVFRNRLNELGKRCTVLQFGRENYNCYEKLFMQIEEKQGTLKVMPWVKVGLSE